MRDKFFYRCTNCNTEYSGEGIVYLCPSCSKEINYLPPKGVLKVVYFYHHLKAENRNFKTLSDASFLDLLPINNLNSFPNLRIGNTPLNLQRQLGGRNLPFKLYLKDDSQNPTFSFKDRASALVSAFAKEHNLNTILAASTGNAGSSIAGICASQGQKAIVMVPASAPLAKLTQIVMYGAEVVPVDGDYDSAFDLSIKMTEHFGFYNRNTAYNPLTIEGKKTVSFELYNQLSQSLPDRIFVPVGDGVIISGVYKGFEDLLNLNIINKMPIVVAVQAEGSNNLVSNLTSDSFEVKKSQTLADSISVDYPRNFYMAKKFIREYDGEWITLSDPEIMAASSILARESGIFTEPAASAAFAGFLKYFENEKIKPETRNVILLTGSGLKDIHSVQPFIHLPDPVKPNLEAVRRFLKI
jgi:threonine synthase